MKERLYDLSEAASDDEVSDFIHRQQKEQHGLIPHEDLKEMSDISFGCQCGATCSQVVAGKNVFPYGHDEDQCFPDGPCPDDL